MWAFAKGHGTKNDFVLLTDEHDTLAPTDAQVRFLCDRRAGIGGDGLLRAVRARHITGWQGDPDVWFMDYRNADASVAEMCGNGLRVFLRYLVEEGLASGPDIAVGTRAGSRHGEVRPDGTVRVTMGRVRTQPEPVTVALGDRSWPAHGANVGNPHAVVIVGGEDELDALNLERAPQITPNGAFPAGVNVEFVQLVAARHARMRVFERGAGETLSCGTGTVAVAAILAQRGGVGDSTWRIDVPGGSLGVELTAEGAWLSGPAVIVARGLVSVPQVG
ncbi:MAG: diaminopimelate epimerase [Micropruina sp.]|nr:diaminopimelate epimerase [Micropruina sp.]